MSASSITITVFSGIGIVLSVIPLSWHLPSGSVGTSMLAIWTALGCLNNLINGILWYGNTVNRAPVWCDISIRFQYGLAVALSASGLCIIRSLSRITSASTAIITPEEKRRAMIIDLLLTIGLPILQMAVEYVVAGYRFSIYDDYGCGEAVYNSFLAFLLLWSWPLIVELFSAYYGARAFFTFMKRRKQFKELLTIHGNMTYSRYWRLMVLACTNYFFGIPLNIWVIVQDIKGGVDPWVSWEYNHANNSRVIELTSSFYDEHPLALSGMKINRAVSICCAFLFFGLFGLTAGARKNYRIFASAAAKLFGHDISWSTSTTHSSAPPTLKFATRRTKPHGSSTSLSDTYQSGAVDKGFGPSETYISQTESADWKPKVPEPIFDPESPRPFALDTLKYDHPDSSVPDKV